MDALQPPISLGNLADYTSQTDQLPCRKALALLMCNSLKCGEYIRPVCTCLNGIISAQRNLRRKADAAQQILEARVGTQGVPGRVNFEHGETGALLVSLFEPREGLVLLAQPHINEGEGTG